MPGAPRPQRRCYQGTTRRFDGLSALPWSVGCYFQSVMVDRETRQNASKRPPYPRQRAWDGSRAKKF